MQTFDVIVVGAGGMGTAAAWQLARRGARVLALDRFPPGHDRGSSHGQTRLIRQAYYEHPDYVPLLLEAYEAWRDLEAACGRRLLVESGLVMAGPETGAVVPGALQSARIHGLTVETLTAGEAAARWPALRIPPEFRVVFEPRGGYLLVDDCVRAQAEQARAHGADLRAGITVHGWRTVGDDVVVETDGGRFAAARLVLCPGAWATDLLQMPQVPLVVLRKSLFWYGPPAAAGTCFDAGTLPCFAFDTEAGFFYGFPRLDDRGVKLAEHTGGQAVADPLAVDRGVDPAEQDHIEQVITTHLPALGRDRCGHATCLYTMSPDAHFLLGPHSEHPQVAIAAGFSGHGFKFASVVGGILADLALTGATSAPIGFLAPTRFGGCPPKTRWDSASGPES
jgi:sarcosine oxidase